MVEADEPARPARVVVTGTPGGLWARAVVAVDAAGIRIDENAWLEADAASAPDPDVRLLVFVEPPLLGLAARFERGECADPTEWLAGWREGAQALARLLQNRPDLCVAIDFEEASRAPDALSALLVDEFGVRLRLDAAQVRPDPLALMLARECCGQRSPEARLHDALVASCRPLAADAPDLSPSVTTQAAIRRYGELLVSADGLAQASSLLGGTRPGASLADLLRATLAGRAALETTAAELRRDASQLLAQLHAAQEELEQVFLQRQGLQADLQRAVAEVAELRAQCEAAEKRASESAVRQKEAAKARDSLAEEIAAAKSELARQAQSHDQAAQGSARRIQELEARLAEAAEGLRTAQADSTSLLAQLHRTQEELEGQFLGRKAAEDRLAQEQRDAKSRQEKLEAGLAQEGERLQAAQADARQLLAQLHQIQEELESTFVALKSAESKLTEARRAQKAQAAELASLGKERDQLAAQADRRLAALKAVREAGAAEREKLVALAERRLAALEAQRVERGRQAASRAAERRAAVAAGRIVHGPMVVGRERLEPPCRELVLEIRDLQLRTARVGSAEVRLVEHHGRAGLVVFGEEGVEHWLRGWRETGREGDRPFALLIPGDAAHDSALREFDATDWRALRAVTQGIEEVLRSPGAAATAPQWVEVVNRLRSLLDTDTRPRFDRCVVRTVEGSVDAAELSLEGTCCGSRDVGVLRLRWQRDGSPALALLPDAWGRYPLLHPSAELVTAGLQGQPLTLATGAPLKLAAQALSGMAVADREFLLACVALLPRAWVDAAEGEAGVASSAKAQIEAVAREAATALDETTPLLMRLAGLKGRLRSPKRV